MVEMTLEAENPVRAYRRIGWIDSIRASAIVLVLLCHSTELCYSLSVDGFRSYGAESQIASSLLFSLGRMGVPFFLFMTGFLQLGKTYDDQACRRYWKSKWLALFVCVEIWIVIYDLFLAFYSHEELSVVQLLQTTLFLEPVNIGHFWYMPMILGIMLFLPFLANGLRGVSTRSLRFPMAVVFVSFLLLPVLGLIARAFGGGSFSTILNVGFTGGAYGFYVVVGLLVKRGEFKRIPSMALILGGLLSVSALCAIQIGCLLCGIQYNVWYDNCFLAVAALCVFELASRSGERKGPSRRSASTVIARHSFAIYLLHFPILLLLKPPVLAFFNGIPMPGTTFLAVMCLTAATLAISLLLSFCLLKIPKFGKILLYAK